MASEHRLLKKRRKFPKAPSNNPASDCCHAAIFTRDGEQRTRCAACHECCRQDGTIAEFFERLAKGGDAK